MPYVPISAISRRNLLEIAERRWSVVRQARPDLAPALDLHRRLLGIVMNASQALDEGRLPRLSLPAKYVAAKLTRGVPLLAGEPIPLPLPLLTPAVAEVVGGHRTLRCSFCAAAWELNTYACIYCAEGGESFVTAAPDEERKDRRLELCHNCGGYLKTIDVAELSPFPLLSISDIETTDLDVAAMEHRYARPPLKEFGVGAAREPPLR